MKKLVVILFLFISVLAFSQKPIAKFPFNGNANDVSGNGYNGVVTSATLTTDRFGNPNSAYNFAGGSARIDVSHSTAFDLGDFTYSIWVSPNSVSSGWQTYITNTTDEAWLGQNEGTYVTWGVCGANATPVQLGWHHLVWVRSGTTTRLYVDNVVVQDLTSCPSGIMDSNGMIFGSNNLNEAFNGSIDDIYIYNRALSNAEVGSLFLEMDPSSFNTTWITTDGTITIPTTGVGYNYSVTWSNLTNPGVGEGYVSGQTGNYTITGLQNGSTYRVSISGAFPRIYFQGLPDVWQRDKIKSIEQWGNIAWTSMQDAFNTCRFLTYNATDAPDLTNVTSLRQMFLSAQLLNGDLSNWNTSTITDMAGTFFGTSSFNGNISTWNTANVTAMNSMFDYCDSFNGDISGWDVSKVTNMMYMFEGATSFNQNLSSWNTAGVNALGYMFFGATAFNQNLGSWNISKVIGMNNMLDGTAISTDNYDATLAGWAAQTVQSGVTLGAAGLTYCNSVARNKLTSAPNNWSINDAGQNAGCPVIFQVSSPTPDGTYGVGELIPIQVTFNTAVIVVGTPTITLETGTTDRVVNYTSGSGTTTLTFNYTVQSGDASPDLDYIAWSLTAGTSIRDANAPNYNASLALPTPGAIGSLSDNNDIVIDINPSASFITTWITTDGSITIPTTGSGYNYSVSWTNLTNPGVGEGSVSGQVGNYTINGLQNGSVYEVSITGDFPRIYFNNAGDRQKIVSIEQWGDIAWSSMESAFNGCTNLIYNASDAPDLSSVTSLQEMFRDCSIMNGNLSGWNLSNVSNLNGMFRFATTYNQPVNTWDVSSVTDFTVMFEGASAFNQPLSNWNMISAVSIPFMFNGATAFNQPLASWNVSNVQNMDGVFAYATSFNQDISAWNTGNVTRMVAMFLGASGFNQPIGNWNVSKVTTMGEAGAWSGTFKNATSFNQSLANWNIGLVTNMTEMLTNSGLSTSNYDLTLAGWAAQTVQPNVTLGADGLTYCNLVARGILTSAPNNWTITGDINGSPAAPNAVVGKQPTCAEPTGRVDLSGLPIQPWTVTAMPGEATITGSASSAPFTGLPPNETYSFNVKIDGTFCQSAFSNAVVINAEPDPPVLNPSTTNNTACVGGNGSATVIATTPGGEPVGGYMYTWYAGPDTSNPIPGANAATLSNVAGGTYTVEVLNNDFAGCVALTSVLVADEFTLPVLDVSSTANSYCVGFNGTASVIPSTPSSEPVGGYSYQWYTGSGTSNPISGATASTATALSPGNYTVQVTNNDTGCNDIGEVEVFDLGPPAYIIDTYTINQPTCAVPTGSVDFYDIFLSDWTITASPGGATLSGTTETGSFTGLAPGTYIFYLRDNPSGCTVAETFEIIIDAVPDSPVVATATNANTACLTGNGSAEVTAITLGGIPVDFSEFSFQWFTGVGTDNPLGATTIIITDLAPGEYTVLVTHTISGCSSTTSVLIEDTSVLPVLVINSTPNTYCVGANGEASVIASTPGGEPVGGYSYQWEDAGGPISGATSNTLSNVTGGTYTVLVTNNDTGCTSVIAVEVFQATVDIFLPPTIGTIIQPTCDIPTGSVLINDLPTEDWILTASPGGATLAGNTSAATFEGLTGGQTFTFNYVLVPSGCASPSTIDVVIDPVPTPPSTPIVGTITQPTCATPTGSVALSGLPVGAWTINPGAIAGSGTTTTLTGLAPNTYNFTVTEDATGCNSPPTSDVIINAVPTAPPAPTVGTITQPTCATPTGSVALSGLPAGAWTINPGAIVGSGTTTTLTGLAPATYNFTVTETATGCTSTATADVIINTVPGAPSTPVVGTITQPTCATPTGSVALSGLPAGSWTINPGAITGSGTTTTLTGLAPATYNFTVTETTTGCTSVATTDVIINVVPGAPATPTVGTITQPTCAVPTGSVVLSGLPAGNWTINPGAIAGSGTTTTLTGLAPNTYNFTVTEVATGCNSPPTSDVIINAVPTAPPAPTVGTITQPTCATPTGSVALSGLPAGAWTINPGAIAGSGTTFSLTGLAPATYNFTVTDDVTGCTSTASADVVINVVPDGPQLIISTTPNSLCVIGNGTASVTASTPGNEPAGGYSYQWEDAGGPISGATTNSISNLLPGTYTVIVTNNETGCSSSISDVVLDFSVEPSALIVGTITQPTCATPTGSVALSGLPAGAWTINPGAIVGSGTTTTLTGLVPATYNFTVTETATGCTSTATADVIINAVPGAPLTPVVGTITQPTCATPTGSVALSGLPAGAWTINPGAIAGSGTTFTLTGLAPATYNFTVTETATGCTSTATADVIINVVPGAPSTPIVGTITQPTCATPTGSVALSGLPAGAWTINPGAIAGSGTTFTLSGLAPATYNFTVTETATGCISTATADVIINAVPGAPVTPIVGTITQPTCATPTGSVALSGLPAGAWTINPGAIAGSGTTFTLTGLAPNTYNFTVTETASGCTSVATADVIINVVPGAPSTPIVGTITQPTCATPTGSVALSGLPAGAWTINPGAIAGSGTTTILTGLVSATYNFTVTETATGCTSVATADVIINVVPGAPSTPIVGTITQPTCATPTGSVALSGLPAGAWTINPGAIAGSGTTFTLTGLAPATYNFTVTETATGCTSTATADVIINAVPGAPSTPVVGTITQPTCATPTGSVALSGLPAGAWTINPGAIVGSGSTTTLTGLAPATYNFTVTETATGCISTATADVIINVVPGAPSTPVVGTITQPTCAVPTGSVALSGLPAGAWTINSGAIVGSGTTTTLTGLVPATYNFTVTETATGCISTATADVIINVVPGAPSTPVVGTITQPTCATPTGSVALSGLPAGAWTINPGAVAGSGTTFTLTGLAPSTYNFTITETATGCTSTATADVIINAVPGAPATPIVGTITQPTCATPTGSVALSGLPAGAWTINPGAIAGSGATTTLTNLAPNTYNFTVTETTTGCTSVATADVILLAAPGAPAAPTASVTAQPTCSIVTGTITITVPAPGAGITYTVAGTNPLVSAQSNATGIFTGLAPGNYDVTTTLDGCTSTATSVTVNAVPIVSVPVVGTITQPSCSLPSGSVALSGLPSGAWSINPGAISGSGATTIITGLAPATYNFTVTEISSGCISLATANVLINAIPTVPGITLGTFPSVRQGNTSVALPYSGTLGSPNEFTIDFDGAAESQGFADVAYTTNNLTASPIALSLPRTANAATYNATITVRNTATGCESAPVPFTIELTPSSAILAETNNGLATSPLLASSANQALLGISLVSDGRQQVNGLTFTASAAPGSLLSNFRLFRSANNTFDGSDVSIGSVSVSGTSLSINGLAEDISTIRYFFLVADVGSSVTTLSSSVQFTLAAANVSVSPGTVTGSVTGTTYSFISSDGTPPTVLSITYQTPASSPTNATSLTYQVVFSEAVINVDAADFTKTFTGLTSGAITVSAVNQTTYNVTVASVAGNGTARIDVLNTATITDLVGNAYASNFVTGQVYTVDQTAPVFSAIAPASNATVTNAVVSYTLSEALVSGTITWARTGGTADAASPHNQSLTGTELTAGPHPNITLTNSPNLVSGAIYSITFSGTDAAGNTASPLTNTAITFTAPASSLSDIVASTTFTYPQNINYALFQESDNIQNTGSSIAVAQFTIRDGGASGSDSDQLLTVITGLSLDLGTNFSFIRRIALYDASGNTELSGSESAVNNRTVNFTNLQLSTSDNGTLSFTVRVSFTTTVTDNQQFSFTISNATTQASGSGLASPNGGGASSSVAGNNNRIEVIASKLNFVQQPSNTFVDEVMTPAVTLEAIDGNNNRDLDFSGTVGLVSQGSLSTSPVAILASGLGTSTDIIFSSRGIDLTLTTSNGAGLTNATSSSFDVYDDTEGIVVTIRSFITPNTADDQNNVLFIENIEYFPENTVKLIDRWGVPVKSWTNFTNYSSSSPEQADFDFTTLGIGSYICNVEYKDPESGNKKSKSQMITVLK
jgi:surface protein